ncbi:hypothetical protein DPEC_G00114950 [Dallia pectoralis]|uniref:Uncharacterized protein n=1 Tax=Dallia pectoralis TaxID=75939 RepID=A0ACC2GU16_DALPE|nr:hypothetical protein DPEC_G00114950 [Dallia pectoralis]
MGGVRCTARLRTPDLLIELFSWEPMTEPEQLDPDQSCHRLGRQTQVAPPEPLLCPQITLSLDIVGQLTLSSTEVAVTHISVSRRSGGRGKDGIVGARVGHSYPGQLQSPWPPSRLPFTQPTPPPYGGGEQSQHTYSAHSVCTGEAVGRQVKG